MPGLRQTIVWDLPRSRLALAQQNALAKRLNREGYGTALVMPRTWKSALAPFLAGIPERVGFFGEGRLILLNDLRFGERKLPRMVDRCAMLALPRGAKLRDSWPLPRLKVAAAKVAAWRNRRGLMDDGRPVEAFAPGAVGPSKRWPSTADAELARHLLSAGFAVWVLGGPDEKPLADEIVGDSDARDLTGNDLREAIFALAAASIAVSNDFGPPPRSRGPRHALDRYLRADQSLALGAAQSARRGDAGERRTCLPAVPQTGMPGRSSPLHARPDAAGSSRCDPPGACTVSAS